MIRLVIPVALLVAQMMNSQVKPISHLRPYQNTITVDFGGKLLELINAPAVISLPGILPKPDQYGNPWMVDIKNLGPHAVVIGGKNKFSATVGVNQTLHIYATRSGYMLKR